MRLRLVFMIFALFLLSCNKNDIDRIPDVYVNYSITLQEFSIRSQNGLLLVNAQENTGVAGLIIYRRPDNAYVAYDRCSSVNPMERCAVIPDDPNITATDPCSGARFSLYDGSPIKAPAVRPLKEYQVIITNFGLTVRN